jgi:hypothetical protein
MLLLCDLHPRISGVLSAAPTPCRPEDVSPASSARPIPMHLPRRVLQDSLPRAPLHGQPCAPGCLHAAAQSGAQCSPFARRTGRSCAWFKARHFEQETNRCQCVAV